jgi:hypothetical protein
MTRQIKMRRDAARRGEASQAARPTTAQPPPINAPDQTSIAASYVSQLSSSSGARYQRVTTYSVMCASAPSAAVRASPKSQILRSHEALRSTLDGCERAGRF